MKIVGEVTKAPKVLGMTVGTQNTDQTGAREELVGHLKSPPKGLVLCRRALWGGGRIPQVEKWGEGNRGRTVSRTRGEYNSECRQETRREKG